MKTKTLLHLKNVSKLQAGKFLFCGLLVLISFGVQAQDIPGIRKVFGEFQLGYARRDTAATERFADHLFARNIFIIGTGSDEWINGLQAAKKLVKNDWLYWLNLSIDTAQLNLQKAGNIYLFSVPATAFIQFPSKDAAYGYSMSQVNGILKNEPDNRLKLLSLARESTNMISEIEKGDLNVRYQLRITGALVQQDGNWVFQQLVYSFPYPMKRQ